MSDDHRCSSLHLLMAFVAGAATGAAVALLTTPRTGKENREKLAEWARRAKEEAANAAPELRAQADRVAQAVGLAAERAFGGDPRD
jgi:gas vesicle protein